MQSSANDTDGDVYVFESKRTKEGGRFIIGTGITKGMTDAEQDKLREEHGFKRVGPPIKDFKKW